jgi:copper(I)-binding protein
MWKNASGVTLVLAAIIVVPTLVGLGACKGEPPRLTVENPRAMMSEAMRDEASVSLTIRNEGGRDSLVRVKTDIPGATADIHEMRGDLMVISQGLPIPGKNSLELGPLRSHIMLAHLPESTKTGDLFMLTLVFARSGELQVPVRIERTLHPMTHEHH